MLKKTITYKDFNDVERTEDFYFNLTKSEITEMELSVDGGLAATMQRIVDSKDMPALMKEFKKLLLLSYGEKSADGKRFIKSKELSEAFEQTGAYDNLFMELITNDKAASDFINAILPADLHDKLSHN